MVFYNYTRRQILKKEILLFYNTATIQLHWGFPKELVFSVQGALSGCSVSWGKEVEKVMWWNISEHECTQCCFMGEHEFLNTIPFWVTGIWVSWGEQPADQWGRTYQPPLLFSNPLSVLCHHPETEVCEIHCCQGSETSASKAAWPSCLATLQPSSSFSGVSVN